MRPDRNAPLGTFAGVFTPSILTILGMVLFLRLGYVVGAVGFGEALLILAIAHAISILTSLSVSAIATNLRVKGGGDYYLISRTLGLGYGAAIGLVLFLAQSVAAGFYCIGLAEAVGVLVGSTDPMLARAIGAAAVIALFVLAWGGTAGATRVQYGVMVLLVAALAAFAVGALGSWSELQLRANLRVPDAAPFWVAFAIFFPAVTGFTQGVSMSGELRDAGRSIPLGTLSAVAVAMLIYAGAALLFAGAAAADALAQDGAAMKRLSAVPVLFDAGVIAATLSSALASILGAPRILYAMARDQVLPVLEPFAQAGHGGNPRRALLLTLAIALAVILAGNLDAVAGIVSMFFLMSYALLNYATYYEARSASPSFRPAFRFFSRHASLAGAGGCAAVMLAIDSVAALVAGAIVLSIVHYVRLRGVPARWADSQRSYHLQQVREHLLAARLASAHARDWRPQVLVFSEDPARRARVLKFASWIEAGAGIVTVAQVLERQGPEALAERQAVLERLTDELRALDSRAFPLVIAAPRLDEAIAVVVQAAGVGPVQANTVIANWLREPGSAQSRAMQRFGQNLRTAFRAGCNLLMLDAQEPEWQRLEQTAPRERRIDLWWAGGVTSRLLLLLAHLMTRSPDWEDAPVRVLLPVAAGEDATARERQVRELLEDVRILARTHVVAGGTDALVAASTDASLVFVPVALQADGVRLRHGGGDPSLTASLPIVVLAVAAEDVDLGADPDTADGPKPRTA